MTATAMPSTPTRTGPTAPRRSRARARWRRRWYRAVAPLAVVALLAGVTLLARQIEEPSLRRDDTLSPVGTGRDGSSELAALLAGRGVRIDHVVDIEEAFAAAETGPDSVVFVPKPTQFAVGFAAMARYFPGEHTVVMVAPSRRQLQIAGAYQVAAGPTRWASAARPPGCSVPAAVAAGRAAALRSRYDVADGQVCYQGGLVSTRLGAGPAAADLVVVGSTDPFRNRRIDEHGNATLAVELLASHDRVIWVDALPYQFNFEWPDFPGFRRPDLPDLPEVDPPERREQDRTGGSGLDQLVFGYDPRILAGLALLAILALLVAVARSRRLGPPVSEPLPVLVPAAEVVAGQGRLYQRARGRGTALAALRAAALRRVAAAVGLPAAPLPEPESVVAAVAARTGLPENQVRHVLYGPEPADDEELTQAVAALDALVETVTREGGAP